jgi:uncharacterized membrane protein YfhO
MQQTKVNTNTILSKILPYIMAFGIPILLRILLILFYQSGFGHPYANILSIFSVFASGLAASCFLFYLRHTHSFSVNSIYWQLLFSFSYALSSVALIQDFSGYVLFLYACFPLFFLSHEQLVSDSRCLPFILFAALYLLVSPDTAVPILILLTVLFVIELSCIHCLNLGSLAQYLFCLIFSVLLSGIRLFPYISQTASQRNSYEGFSFTTFYASYGFHFYFGLLALLLCILFYCLKNIHLSKKIAYTVFTLLLISALQISPVRFILYLFSEPDTLVLSYSFILVFWLLRLSSEAASHLNTISVWEFFIASFLYILLLFAVVLLSKNTFHTVTVSSMILFTCLELLLLALFKKRKNDFILLLLFCIAVLELFCNAFVSSNQDYVHSETTASAAQDVSDDYYNYLLTHTDLELYSLINQLTTHVTLSESEYQTYGGKDLLNNFEYMNAVCHKIGISSDLFTYQDFPLSFEASDDYDITPLGDNIYNIGFHSSAFDKEYCYLNFSLENTSGLDSLYYYNDYTGDLLKIDTQNANETSTGYILLPPSEQFNLNIQMLIYSMDEDVYQTIPAILTAYVAEQNQNTSLLLASDYLGLAATLTGILLLLIFFFHRQKQQLLLPLQKTKNTLSNWDKPGKVYQHLYNNSVYYLAFLIPFLCFIICMIIFDCVPFGSNSFFDEDGFYLTLPSYLDINYNLQNNNTYLSMCGGYGYSLYALNPAIPLLYFMKFLSPGQIAPLLLFGEAICLGLCGFSMVFYLTHRLTGTRASKNDICLLIPSCIYTLSTFMLAMHGFTSWYYVFLAFPLLLLSMDYLMIRKKAFPYIFILSLCFILNLYLSLYICIFLIIYFFTYHFDTIKDFFQKGFRFALCSILCAGNAFFVLLETILSSRDLAYTTKDSILPTPGFYTSFWEQWSHHMIFSSSKAVTADNGYISIYFGILAMILVLVYFSSNISWKEKLRKLIPIAILYISFNGQVLSYLWNGFHYQSKVPNRYVFLLLFLVAVISYDAIRQLHTVSIKRLLMITLSLIAFFCACQYLGTSNTQLAFIATLILCGFYFLLHCVFQRFHYSKICYQLLTGFFLIEIVANMIFTVQNYSLTSYQILGNYEGELEYVQNTLNGENEFFRISFPSSSLANTGLFYHIGSNSLFNSYVSQHQLNSNYMYGFYYGVNNIGSNYDGTPITQSLIGTRYLFIPVWNNMPIEDLDQYEYIGRVQNDFVYENSNALSLGIYTSEALVEQIIDSSYIPNFYNELVKLYTGGNDDLFTSQYLEYKDMNNTADDVTDNYFYFTDADGNILSFEEAEELYTEGRKEANMGPITALRLHLKYTPQTSGETYLYSYEFISLGDGEEGVTVEKDIYYPNPISQFRDGYNFVIMNEDVLADFYQASQGNQLEDVCISNNSITGTSNYEQDGYTMFSIAYDKNWHAYLDGEEVEIENPYDSVLFVKTPAGQHTIELKYIPYGMKTGKLITLIFWIITFAFYGITRIRKNA